MVSVSPVADVSDDSCFLEALEVLCLSICEVFMGNAGERVGVPQQGFGLGTPSVGERRADAVGLERVQDRIAIPTVEG